MECWGIIVFSYLDLINKFNYSELAGGGEDAVRGEAGGRQHLLQSQGERKGGGYGRDETSVCLDQWNAKNLSRIEGGRGKAADCWEHFGNEQRYNIEGL